MGRESFGVDGFDLGPLKVLITRLLLVVEVWDGKPTHRKS